MKLTSREIDHLQVEAVVNYRVLNRMAVRGMPRSDRISKGCSAESTPVLGTHAWSLNCEARPRPDMFG